MTRDERDKLRRLAEDMIAPDDGCPSHAIAVDEQARLAASVAWLLDDVERLEGRLEAIEKALDRVPVWLAHDTAKAHKEMHVRPFDECRDFECIMARGLLALEAEVEELRRRLGECPQPKGLT